MIAGRVQRLPPRRLLAMAALVVVVLVLSAGAPPLQPTGPSPGSAAPTTGAASLGGGLSRPGPMSAHPPEPGARGEGRPSGIVSGFAGLNSSQPSCGCAGTNVSAIVGPNDTLELVEGNAAWYSAGASLLRTAPLASFFELYGDRVTGPSGGFDRYLDRFVAVASDGTTGSLRLGLSDGPNSTVAWKFYNLTAPAGDRLGVPTLGVGDEVITVAAPASNATGANLGSMGFIVNGTLLRNDSTLDVSPFGPLGATAPSIQAVDVAGSLTGGLFVASGPSQLTVTATTGVPPYPVQVRTATISVTGYAPALPLAQPGTNDTLAAPQAGSFGATDNRGILSLVRTVAEAGVDAVQLVQANLTTDAERQDRLVGAGLGLFAPAVTSDAQGDFEVVAGLSNTTVFPSLVAFGQPYNEPRALGPLIDVAMGASDAGTPCNASHVCAWGDAYSAVPDPANPTGLWLAGTYVDGSGANWSTYIALANAPPLSAPVLVSDLPSIDLGQAVNFTVFVAGGTGADTFGWSGLPFGCTPLNRSDIPCRPSAAGTTTVRVNVTDSGGISVAAPPLSFTTEPGVTLPAPVANRTSADDGQPVGFSAVPQGGAAPYAFAWSPPALATCGPARSVTLNCTFTGNGTATIGVAVTDSNGEIAQSALAYRVYPVPTLGAISVSPPNLVVGGQMNLSVPIAGGTAPFLFVWTGLPAGCSSQSADHLSCVPTSVGADHIHVVVTDGNGVSANATLSVNVLAASRSGGGGIPALDGILLAFAVVAGGALIVVFFPRKRREREAPADTSMIYGGPMPRAKDAPLPDDETGPHP